MLTKYFTRTVFLHCCMVLIVIGAAVGMGRLVHSRFVPKGARTGGPIPYTVVLKEANHRLDGSIKPGIELTLAVRSDGSFVWRLAYEGSKGFAATRTVQFPSGVEVTVNEITGAQSTMTKKINSAALQRDPNSKCMNSFAGVAMTSPPEVFGGEEIVAGYRAAKLVSGNATMWFALDYGCAMIGERTDWGGDGFGEKTLVSMASGEPVATLFSIGGKEMPPSQRIASGQTLDAHEKDAFRKQDEYYYSHRPGR